MKEKGKLDWAAIGRSVLASLLLYTVLQFGGAALVWGELVSEEQTPWLITASAALAALISQLVFLRRIKSGRLVVCLLSGLGFGTSIALLGMAVGTGGSLREIPLLLLAILAGSFLAAMAAGGKKGRKRKSRGYIK